LTDSVQYQASFPAALADDAGKRFTDHVYRRMFGWKIGLCLLIDVIGCIVGVVLTGWTMATIVLCALIGLATVYFIANYFLRPRVMSQRILRAFGSGATITLRPDGFDIEVGPDKMTRAWGRQRALLEFEPYFLLVILPTIALVLPREGMPAQGVDWIRAAMAGPMTRSRFPGA
jgi:hypothetical protein